MPHFQETRWPTTNSIRRLRATYVAALALIAVCLLAFAMAMLEIVPSQNDDAHIVNVSGRQRMLSQRLFKVLLLLSNEAEPEARDTFRLEIQELLGQWTQAQQYLQGTDPVSPAKRSDSIRTMLRAQVPYFQSMVEVYSQVSVANPADTAIIRRAIAVMRQNEPPFLDLQEQITDQFQHEADHRLEWLGIIAVVSFIILFLLIVAEGFLVFRPMASQIKLDIETLTCANDELRAATEAKDISEMNLRRLLSVYPDITLVFDEYGTYTDIFTASDHLLYVDRESLIGHRLHDIFPTEQADFFLKAITTTLQTLQPSTFSYSLPLPSGIVSFRATTTFFENVGGHRHAVMFVRDISKEIEVENRERRYQQKLLQTIIETQENERSRIASDMHDGIGQMFAVLKLNIASLRRTDDGELFDDVLESIDTIINELRSIAANLMPASLERFGLISTLQSEAEVLQQRFGIVMNFSAQTLSTHYPPPIEICVYRIVQELLANIINHSRASTATVRITESDESLTVEVQDDGRGFDPREQINGGRGLINIQSRVLAFGGSISIDSSDNSGSSVRIQIPIAGYGSKINDRSTTNGKQSHIALQHEPYNGPHN